MAGRPGQGPWRSAQGRETIMNVHQHLRTLASASLLALAIVNVPAGLAYAAPKSEAQRNCETRGFTWVAGRGCADKECPDNTGGARHGATRQVRQRIPGQYLGPVVTQVCD